MAQEWQIDGPKVLDIGDEFETVSKLKIGLVAGRVDIVTHDDSPTARLEVHEVEGRPLLSAGMVRPSKSATSRTRTATSGKA